MVVRPEPGLEPGEIDEGLERRARLAHRLGRPVELAGAVAAAADDGAHRAVGRHRDERRLARRRLFPVTGQGLRDRRLGRRLQAGIEGRDDDQILVLDAADIAELLDDPVGEVAAAGAGRGDAGELRALLRRARRLFRLDVAGIDHVGENLRGTLGGALAVARRAEPGRRLEQAGDDRRFVEGELARRLVEVAVRRGIDAVGSGAEIDAVEIDLEELVLGEFVLEP